MTGLPIPFKPEMIRALLREVEHPGTGKTQTRRLIGRRKKFGKVTEFGRSDTRGYDWHVRDRHGRMHDIRHVRLLEVLPYAVGDRLWVKEAWHTNSSEDAKPPSKIDQSEFIWFCADGEGGMPVSRYRHSMFMPRWASRLVLTVTDVRVEQLQQISVEGAEAEGWPGCGKDTPLRDAYPIGWFANLWDRINGKGAYESDPFVPAYTFTVERRNIDEDA